jgi:hypothetical protein
MMADANNPSGEETREMPAAKKQAPPAQGAGGTPAGVGGEDSTTEEKQTPAATDQPEETQTPEGPGQFVKEDPVVLRQVEVALQDGPVDEPEPSGTWRVGPAPIQHNGELILPGDTVSAADLESDDVPFSGERMLQDLVNAGALIPEEQYEEPQARQAAAPQEGEVWVNYRDVDNRVAAVGGVGDETNARYVMATTDSEPINVPQSEGQTGTSVKVQPSATRAITNRNNG